MKKLFESIPVTLEFNDYGPPVAKIEFVKSVPNLHEYMVCPSYIVNPKSGVKHVVGWSLVHRSHVLTSPAKIKELEGSK